MRTPVLICRLALFGLLGGCSAANRRALTPETVGVSVGGNLGFDRDSQREGARNLGCSIVVTPVWRIKPAPVAKVADITSPNER